jgi:hypothetical protein
MEVTAVVKQYKQILTAERNAVELYDSLDRRMTIGRRDPPSTALPEADVGKSRQDSFALIFHPKTEKQQRCRNCRIMN